MELTEVSIFSIFYLIGCLLLGLFILLRIFYFRSFGSSYLFLLCIRDLWWHSSNNVGFFFCFSLLIYYNFILFFFQLFPWSSSSLPCFNSCSYAILILYHYIAYIYSAFSLFSFSNFSLRKKMKRFIEAIYS